MPSLSSQLASTYPDLTADQIAVLVRLHSLPIPATPCDGLYTLEGSAQPMFCKVCKSEQRGFSPLQYLYCPKCGARTLHKRTKDDPAF